jgi:GntR family transcriptional regulator, N-acetylglucosamine utilization regulator
MEYKPSIPAYIQIKDDIIQKIRIGRWQENQKISSEQQLIAEYNVGRGTVREAIKLVIDEGYLFIKKGIGTFVSQKEVGISIEPFVSLTYFIKMRGLQLKTEILEKEEMQVTEALALFTGLDLNSTCLYVKRLRVLEGKPIGIEEFYFSEKSLEYLKDYDFTKGISHYLFEDLKIQVGKMSMDLEVLSASEEIQQILKLEETTPIIESSRIVRFKSGNEILYFLKFYCDVELTRIGINGFV